MNIGGHLEQRRNIEQKGSYPTLKQLGAQREKMLAVIDEHRKKGVPEDVLRKNFGPDLNLPITGFNKEHVGKPAFAIDLRELSEVPGQNGEPTTRIGNLGIWPDGRSGKDRRTGFERRSLLTASRKRNNQRTNERRRLASVQELVLQILENTKS